MGLAAPPLKENQIACSNKANNMLSLCSLPAGTSLPPLISGTRCSTPVQH